MTVEFTATPQEDGERLDVALAARQGMSRSAASRWLDAVEATVAGQAAKRSTSLTTGARVVVPSAPAPDRAPTPPLPPLRHRDEHVVVVAKPPGMVVHPGAGHHGDTLVDALRANDVPLAPGTGPERPGIVHRLDRDTSGLMLVAKHDRSHRALSSALKRREVRRRYLAASWGHLDGDTLAVDAPIGRSPAHRKRMAVVEEGRAARTRFLRLERWRAADLLRAELDTGRTHQIRVHLRHVGHPVVGDDVYGKGWERGFGGRDRAWAAELARRAERQFLHAAELEFRHPRDGRPLRFTSPLPDDLQAVADWARDG